MNTLYQGDNLSIMRSLPDTSVDLICTDPPFNTGRDWVAFDDRWEGGLKGYLKFMEARLIECQRVLKDTGSLYLHCDPTASHYLKVMLDTIFGIDNFRNEIVWCYVSGGKSKKGTFKKNHDVILFYVANDTAIWNEVRIPYTERYIDTHFKQVGNKKLYRRMLVNGKMYVYDADDGMLPLSYWDIPIVNAMATERLGYPTQKPLALYERMIQASSNQGDVVLDLFAGSGTTLDAAESLGRQWIGIDEKPEAIEIIQKRLRDRHGLLLNYVLK